MKQALLQNMENEGGQDKLEEVAAGQQHQDAQQQDTI